MRNRTLVPREEREPVPDFTPVPRKYRYDGWTPERQKAFIEALAETGCVDRAARMVNMAQANCYTLRRAPGAEEFRRAWDAALDFGVKRLKDIAFQRAIEGQLVPVFVAGKMIGFRRVYNDKLLMFCLRHYGEDANGRRTTINYFSTRASASAGAAAQGAGDRPSTGSGLAVEGSGRAGDRPSTGSGLAVEGDAGPGAGARAEASTTTVRTVISGAGDGSGAAGGRLDSAAATLGGFEGVALDAEAEAAIAAALEACAARAREAEAAHDKGGEAAAEAAADDPDSVFCRSDDPYHAIEPPMYEEFVPFSPGEPHWTLAGADVPAELLAFEARQAAREAAEAGDGAAAENGGAGL
ncbi:MAG TPA: hypothetical protein VGB79_07455 [Allosphingosinicella sp.]|jgi:hypothetical protein